MFISLDDNVGKVKEFIVVFYVLEGKVVYEVWGVLDHLSGCYFYFFKVRRKVSSRVEIEWDIRVFESAKHSKNEIRTK